VRRARAGGLQPAKAAKPARSEQLRLDDVWDVPDVVTPEAAASRRPHNCWPAVGAILVEVIADIVVYDRRVRKGHRGWVTGGVLGRRDFDYHSELPVDGWGMPLEALAVVERAPDGTMRRTPYVAWRRALGIPVMCLRCDVDLVAANGQPCKPPGHRGAGRGEAPVDAATAALLAKIPILE
jgi:hypothetical protein